MAAGNTVELSTATVEQRGVVGDLDSAFDQVEADGHTVTGIAAGPGAAEEDRQLAVKSAASLAVSGCRGDGDGCGKR